MDRRLKKPENKIGDANTLESPLWQSYDHVLLSLEGGCPENVTSFLRELRFKGESDEISETLRKLISLRIAMKSSIISDDSTSLVMKESSIPWIPGEIEFIMGLVKFHQGFFAEGAVYFRNAERIFADIDFEARAQLSAFNSMIGDFYSGKTTDLNTKLEQLRLLEKRARASLDIRRPDQSRIQKVLAMVLREKAVLFEKEARFYAALEELDKAIAIFALEGTRSDYQLALLQAADLMLNLDDPKGALKHYDYVLRPVDTRVEFPLAYIEWRLFEKPLNETAFTVVPPTWLERWKQKSSKPVAPSSQNQERSFKWLLNTNELIENVQGQRWKVKPTSLEGKLLKVLAKTRASKILLGETLWPEFAKVNELDHRLHQLISRINQKYGGIILYDGSAYKLSCLIDIE